MTYQKSNKNKLQSPRTKLLYFIYCCHDSSLKDESGIKSKLRKALGYKSDGHFYHDLNYLLGSGLIANTDGYFKVTKKGKEEFDRYSANYNSSIVMVSTGIILIVYSFLQTVGFSMEGGIAVVGIILIIFGAGLSMVIRRNKPQVSLKAKRLLKELKRN